MIRSLCELFGSRPPKTLHRSTYQRSLAVSGLIHIPAPSATESSIAPITIPYGTYPDLAYLFPERRSSNSNINQLPPWSVQQRQRVCDRCKDENPVNDQVFGQGANTIYQSKRHLIARMGRRPRRRGADAHHSACRRRSIFLAGIGTDPSYIPGHPVAEEPTRSAGGAVRPGSGLTIEGRDLLIALKLFAVSPVHSVNNQQEERLRLASESIVGVI